MNRDWIRDTVTRWRKDYDFRTLINSGFSMLATTVFALYNGFLGIFHDLGWNSSICVYYLILVLIRAMVLLTETRTEEGSWDAKKGQRIHLAAAALLLFLNLCMIAPLALMVKQDKPVHMTMIPAIAMAAYTTLKITLASVNLKKKKRSENPLVHFLRSINFIDALMSVAALQNTLIMVNSTGEKAVSMIGLTAVTSGGMWLGAVTLAAFALRRACRAKVTGLGTEDGDKTDGVRND